MTPDFGSPRIDALNRIPLDVLDALSAWTADDVRQLLAMVRSAQPWDERITSTHHRAAEAAVHSADVATRLDDVVEDLELHHRVLNDLFARQHRSRLPWRRDERQSALLPPLAAEQRHALPNARETAPGT